MRTGVPRVRLRDPGEHVRPRSDQAVSYLDDGRQVVCTFDADVPGRGGWVCDAERTDRPARAAVARAWGLPTDPLGFARAWTRLEVGAKAADVPVLLHGRAGTAPPPDVRTVSVPGTAVVVSWARAGAGRPGG